VIGGNTDGESFFPIDRLSKFMGTSSTETCNTYNMLKLTRGKQKITVKFQALPNSSAGQLLDVRVAQQ
jgi:hypothetical protein